MEIRRFDGDDERRFRDAMAIRRAVFIEEQGVPEDREIDGKDSESRHVVAYESDEPIGTGRLRAYTNVRKSDTAKVERVAVSADRRGDGVGRELMRALEGIAVSEGYETIVLYAQRQVIPFYRALGYEPYDDEFEDAGIPHRKMRKALA